MYHKGPMSLLRGVCQTPAYLAVEKGFLEEEGIEAALDVAATVWQVPDRLLPGINLSSSSPDPGPRRWRWS